MTPLTLGPGGLLTVDEYTELADDGAIDTVICAVPDPYGRLMGKRLTPRSFRALALDGNGVRASAYLFATDVEMEPMELPIANAANGWADFRMVPDLPTMRRVPWEPNAVMVLCDAYEEKSDRLLAVAPRSILRAQLDRAADYDLEFHFASELEFYLATTLNAGADGAAVEDIARTSRHRMDYSILQSAADEWFIRLLRNGLDRFGIPVESSKTEWGLGQQEITIDHAPALQMADYHTLFKHSVKQLAAAAGMTASFMAKPAWTRSARPATSTPACGRPVQRRPAGLGPGRARAPVRAVRPVRGRADRLRPRAGPALGPDRELLQALYP